MEFDPRMRISLLIKLADNAFSRYLTCTNNDIEMTASQCQVMGFIHANQTHKEVNPIDIEQHYHLTRPTVTGILQRLEKKGFIELIPSQKDHRYKQIIITEKADRHHAQMMTRIFEAENKMFQNISPEDLEKIKALLMQMIQNISE